MDDQSNRNHKFNNADDGTFNRSLVGSVIAGKYKIKSVLGEGGMSSVHEAQDLVISRIVALKLLSSIRSTDERSVMRFKKEAIAAGRLSHPNIVQLYDVGIHEDGTPYMVMDCVRGETLSERISRHGHLQILDALRIMVQVCDALAHAHEKGVIHRDIKPSNIMITKNFSGEEQVKILDFGIAKVWDEALSVQQSTRTGEVFGSPLYMSPEQAVSGSKVDARSDVYSAACALFEALAGSPPFVGETTLHTIMKHQTDTAPCLREASLGVSFPDVLEKIVAKALNKRQEDRYQTMNEFADALRDVLIRIEHGEKLSAAVSLNKAAGFATRNIKASSSSYANTAGGSNARNAPTKILAILIGVLALAGIAYGAFVFLQSPAPRSTNSSHVAETQSEMSKSGSMQDIPAPSITGFSRRPSSTPTPSHEKNLAALLPEEVITDLNKNEQALLVGQEQDLESDYRAKPNATSLRFRGEQLTPRFFKILTKFKLLNELNITEAKFDDSTPEFASLNKLHLQKVAANRSMLGNRGLLALTLCPTLTKIQINDCKTITDAGLKNINYASPLQVLEARGCNISDAGVKSLSRSRELQSIYLSGNQLIDGKTMGSLAKLPNLRLLFLGDTRIDDKAVAAISNCAHLADLDLSHTQITAASIPLLLKMKSHLKQLILNDTTFDDKEFLKFAGLTNLKAIYVQRCPRITREGVQKFVDTLRTCHVYYDGDPYVRRKSEPD